MSLFIYLFILPSCVFSFLKKTLKTTKLSDPMKPGSAFLKFIIRSSNYYLGENHNYLLEN